MEAQALKEAVAKDVAYAFWVFAPEGSEQERASYMRKNIYPAKRELIDYSGVSNPEEFKQPWFVTPLAVLEESVGEAVAAFYDDMRKGFSLETENEQYAQFQTRMKEGLDRSEQRLINQVTHQLYADAAAKKGTAGILPGIFKSIDQEMSRLEKLTKEETRQFFKNVLLLNYLKKGYANYRFLTKGDNCDACNALKNRVFPISQAKAGENLAPLHLNCDCKTAILDKNGKIAFLAEDQLDKLLSTFDFSKPWEKQADFAKQIKLWELFDFSRPWERKDLAPSYAEKLGISRQEIEDLKQNASLTDILFVDNMIHQYSRYFWNIPSEDKILSALYIVKNYDSETSREKLKEAGFTETYFLWADYGEIGHIFTAYELAQQGVSSAQQDAAYDQRQAAERTALIGIMGGQIADRLLTGPGFDPSIGYSDSDTLDQLEKNGYLTAEQRKTVTSQSKQNSLDDDNVKFSQSIKINGGAARALQFSDGWKNGSLKETVNKIAPNSQPIITDTGKIIYHNSNTKKQVVYDIEGNYFRIEDTTLNGKRVYTDINGDAIPNNKIVNGTQIGISQQEYNQITHFNNTDVDFPYNILEGKYEFISGK